MDTVGKRFGNCGNPDNFRKIVRNPKVSFRSVSKRGTKRKTILRQFGKRRDDRTDMPPETEALPGDGRRILFAELAFDVKNRLLHMLFGNLIDNPHIVSIGRPRVVIDVITAIVAIASI